jgi:hypothetical protein
MNRRIRNLMAVSSFAVLGVGTMLLARPAEAEGSCPTPCASTCGSGLAAVCHRCGLKYQADGCYFDNVACPNSFYKVTCIIPQGT